MPPLESFAPAKEHCRSLPRHFFPILLIFWGVVNSHASAALSLTNWSITSDSLSFDISGTVQVSTAPSTNLGLLWMAAPGNGSWINNDDNPNYTITGTIDGNDASSPNAVFSFTGSGTTNVGAYLDYDGMPPFMPGTSFDFTDGLNNEVDIQVSMSSAGKWNPADIDPSTLQLYWGGDAFSTDTTSAVLLGFDSAPEPATTSLLGLGILGLVMLRRRTS